MGRLEELIENYDRKAQRNYSNYQQTGMSRYLREYERADELAWYLRRAANHQSEHALLGELKASISTLCARAVTADERNDEEEIRKIVKELRAYGRTVLNVRDAYN